MPTPEENMQSVRGFAEEVFGNKNLEYAADWLADEFVEHQVCVGHRILKSGGSTWNRPGSVAVTARLVGCGLRLNEGPVSMMNQMPPDGA